MVIGCSGAGKSTLARRLARTLAIPHVELDGLYWRSGWIERPMSELRDAIARWVEEPAWVMDGNYIMTFDLRAPAADTIVWLDLARWACMYGVLSRIGRGYGRTREGLPAGCPERLDLEFLKYVWNFNARQRPRIVAALEQFPGHAQLHRLESRKDGERFIAMVERR